MCCLSSTIGSTTLFSLVGKLSMVILLLAKAICMFMNFSFSFDLAGDFVFSLPLVPFLLLISLLLLPLLGVCFKRTLLIGKIDSATSYKYSCILPGMAFAAFPPQTVNIAATLNLLDLLHHGWRQRPSGCMCIECHMTCQINIEQNVFLICH